MKLSIVIVTHNRCEALRRTLGILRDHPHLPHDDMELIVVDNGSSDGTAAMLARESKELHIIRRGRNEGVSARNHAFKMARGEYVMLIDDDSYPLGDAADRSMAYLDTHPRTAAVVGRVELPDGRLEASALPTVTINCAVILRRRVIDEVGGLPTEFFRQAEEYDWSFRIWQAGYRIERFEDVRYRHDKAPGNRIPAAVRRYDLRNNLILLERYLPQPLRREYRRDWIQRYGALARTGGGRWAHWRGRVDGLGWAVREAARGRRLLDDATIERIFDLDGQADRIAQWSRRHGIQRVLIADLSKNLYATWRGCREAGLTVVGITDNGPAFEGLRYRDLPVRMDAAWSSTAVDGIVLSNVNPAQVERRAAELEAQFAKPVLSLWQPRWLRDQRPVEVIAA